MPSTASVPHQPNPLVSGLSTMSTPAKPTAIAPHCARCTRSPSNTIDSSAINSGAMKKMEYVLASDSDFRAKVKVTIMNTDMTPRTRCKRPAHLDELPHTARIHRPREHHRQRGQSAQRRHLRGRNNAR